MSAPTAGKKNGKKPGPPPRQEKPDMDPTELMRAMGGNGWFNPQSNDMIRLLRHMAKTSSLPRPMIAMYAWMVWHTTTAGNRQPYANLSGVMQPLRVMADQCGLEIRNCRMYWAKGVEMKIWRNGDSEKGENPEGLYLCSKVDVVEDGPSPKPSDGYVHTPRELFLERFKPYIREKLEQLPAESFRRFATRWDRLEELGNCAHADLFAAVRTVVGQDQDTLLREVGVEKKRLDTAKNKDADELAEITERKARIDRLLLPHVEKYVQSLDASVPTPETGLYEDKSVDVHTSGNGAKNGVANGTNHMPKQPLADDAVTIPGRAPSLSDSVRNSQTPEQAGVSSSPVRDSGASSSLDGEKSVQLPAGELRLLHSLKPEERAGAEKLLAVIADVWRKNPRKFSGEPPNPNDHGQLATAAKMVRMVGLDELDEFGLYIEQKASGRALGHQLTIALLSKIAEEFRAGAADRVRQREAAAAQFVKVQERTRAAVERRQQEDELVERVEAAWEGLSVGEQITRLRAAGEELKADPHWNSVYRHNETEKRRQMELRAKRKLRLEIEKAGGPK